MSHQLVNKNFSLIITTSNIVLNVQVFTDQKCFCAGIGGSLLLWLLTTKLPLLPADEQDKEEKEPLEDEFFFEMVALISKPPP